LKALELNDKSVEILFERNEEFLRLLESLFDVEIHIRGHMLNLEGAEDNVRTVRQVLKDFTEISSNEEMIERDMLRRSFREIAENSALRLHDFFHRQEPIRAGQRRVFPKSRNQQRYVDEIRRSDLVFGIGPAGTGKTFLAVAVAVAMLLEKKVSRLILARPAVEAGEKLGFLPGDMQEKINPYLRPLYDALYHMMDYDKVQKLLEREVIEIAPLAFMRGRTLSEAFVILDEAQNSSPEQMKMFLTRIGIGSKVVVTGDITQVDLPTGKISGLIHARQVLQGIRGISFCYFDQSDVVRHALVQLIINAYHLHEEHANLAPRKPDPSSDASAGEEDTTNQND
jgi:phosphate starvation-inducible PhoH-like protein